VLSCLGSVAIYAKVFPPAEFGQALTGWVDNTYLTLPTSPLLENTLTCVRMLFFSIIGIIRLRPGGR
jgi:hypothetical protein